MKTKKTRPERSDQPLSLKRKREVRLTRVPIRASMITGAWTGFALGLMWGTILGALLVWVAGAVLDWQRQVSFTLGISQSLVPFGSQRETLRAFQQWWYLVIPSIGIILGLVISIFGALVAGILAAAFNRNPSVVTLTVESLEPQVNTS